MKPPFKILFISLIFLFSALAPGFVFAGTGVFKTVLYTGNGAVNHEITGVGFKPDLVWIKARDASYDHAVFDSVRGVGNRIRPNTTDAESYASTLLKSFNSDGFTTGAAAQINESGKEYVAWCWKADQPGITDSTQTEQYSLDSGLSIIKYTGDGVTGRTLTHSLDKEPKMVLIKKINAFGNSWACYHAGIDPTAPADYSIPLDDSLTKINSFGFWSNTAPSSTAITLGTSNNVNTFGDEYIAYAYTDVANSSSFGSYLGNDSAIGPIIDEPGFEPGFLMVKAVGLNEDWVIWDNQRSPLNTRLKTLYANTSGPEISELAMAFRSDGFQPKTSENHLNGSAIKYIYMAFSADPSITFNSDKTTVNYNNGDSPETATLSWEVTDADSVSIDNDIGTVDLSGTIEVTPASSKPYVLTATLNGREYTKEISFVVTNGYDKGSVFTVDGKIGVGVLNPVEALEVNGTIKAKEIIVTTSGWADYVFGSNYTLQDLDSVEAYVDANRHLPGIPSARVLGENGLSVSRMLELQMQKIEELTLHMIELNKENKALKERIQALE